MRPSAVRATLVVILYVGSSGARELLKGYAD
jgi:hypothetical protein